MKAYILLAAAAAIIAPSGAIARPHNHSQHAKAHQARTDQRTVRANRQTIRSDHRTIRANRQTVRSDRNVVRSRQHNTDFRNSGYRARSSYVAPYRSWSYRPVTVGYRLQPSFYGSNYYINDYGTYNLRAPINRWQRWIRYGNDLLLVNIRTGRVLRVVHYGGW